MEEADIKKRVREIEQRCKRIAENCQKNELDFKKSLNFPIVHVDKNQLRQIPIKSNIGELNLGPSLNICFFHKFIYVLIKIS